jgi:hypothetical protein
MQFFNSLFHIHEYDQLDAKGYQRCKHCGKVFWIGLPPKDPTFSIQERVEFTNKKGKIYKITYVQKCVETGELKYFSIRS